MNTSNEEAGKPSGGARCRSHRAGHAPHWIQARKSLEGPTRTGILALRGGGWFTIITTSGASSLLWTHSGDELTVFDGALVEQRSSGVVALSADDGTSVILSVAGEASPCSQLPVERRRRGPEVVDSTAPGEEAP